MLSRDASLTTPAGTPLQAMPDSASVDYAPVLIAQFELDEETEFKDPASLIEPLPGKCLRCVLATEEQFPKLVEDFPKRILFVDRLSPFGYGTGKYIQGALISGTNFIVVMGEKIEWATKHTTGLFYYDFNSPEYALFSGKIKFHTVDLLASVISDDDEGVVDTMCVYN